MTYERLQNALRGSLDTVLENVVTYLPSLAGAAALVLVGWFLARFARAFIARVAGALFGRLGRLSAGSDALQRASTQGLVASAVANATYALVLMVFLLAALQILELEVLDSAVAAIGAYLPHVIAAILVLLGSYVVGAVARGGIARSAQAAGVAYGDAIGRIVQAAIMIVAAIVAMDEIGIDNTLLVVGTGIFFAATLGGAAVAFGLGARTAVSNLLAAHYVRRSYRPGHMVRIGQIEGRILEIGDTVVVVETGDGKVHVPARLFSEQASVLVAEGG